MKGIEVLFILFYTERVCYKENHHLMKINCFLFGRSSNDDSLMKSVPVEQRKLAGQYLREVMAERRTTLKSPKIDKDLKKELEDIQDIVSLSYIAKEYFGKDRTWLYKKINGTIPFTQDEMKILSMALKSIGNKFLDTSASLV